MQFVGYLSLSPGRQGATRAASRFGVAGPVSKLVAPGGSSRGIHVELHAVAHFTTWPVDTKPRLCMDQPFAFNWCNRAEIE